MNLEPRGTPPGAVVNPISAKRILTVSVVLILAAVATIVALQFKARPPSLSHSSSPGTALPSELVVADGSVQLGPVVWEAIGESALPERWLAILAVIGDPLQVWDLYLTQFAQLIPGDAPAFEKQGNPGCELASFGRLDCSAGGDGLNVDGQRISLAASMISVPGDITGRYLINLRVGRYDSPNESYVGPGVLSLEKAPPPQKAAPPPGPGESLSPETLGVLSDRFVLVDGTELVALYGGGSTMGGFSSMLRVLPDADLDKVTSAYIEQATTNPQLETTTSRVEMDGTVFTTIVPPGGAGFQGQIKTVDRPGTGTDYIIFGVDLK